jgi:hypothetical protein
MWDVTWPPPPPRPLFWERPYYGALSYTLRFDKRLSFPITFFILGRITINFDVLSLEVLKIGLDAPLVIFGSYVASKPSASFCKFSI